MALLLQCLRDVRTKSGDFDLIPQQGRGSSLVPRNCDEPNDALSRAEVDEACAVGGDGILVRSGLNTRAI
jgi:hypothetical protein